MEQEPRPGAKESKPEGRGASSAFLSGGSRENNLIAARNFLAGEIGSSAQEPWTSKQWPLIRDKQVALLREWALGHRLWIDPNDLGRSERGRMEHDLLPEMEALRRLWKVTKGAGFGRQPFCEDNLVSGMVSDWFTARPGSPLQYLERLCLVNAQIFPGMNRLEGFTEWKSKFAILISQPFFVGRNATEAEIGTFFRGAGFAKVCHGTWFRKEQPLAVFDAGETNLIVSEGVPVPVDVIPVIPTGLLLERLREAIRMVKR